VTTREERLAENEALFREVNERISDVGTRFGLGLALPRALLGLARSHLSGRRGAAVQQTRKLINDGFPRLVGGFNDVEVIGVGKLEEHRLLASRSNVRTAVDDRDSLVAGTVHEKLGNTERHESGGVGCCVPFGYVVCVATEELRDGSIAEALPIRTPEIRNRR
jgi:hypothetical protein